MSHGCNVPIETLRAHCAHIHVQVTQVFRFFSRYFNTDEGKFHITCTTAFQVNLSLSLQLAKTRLSCALNISPNRCHFLSPGETSSSVLPFNFRFLHSLGKFELCLGVGELLGVLHLQYSIFVLNEGKGEDPFAIHIHPDRGLCFMGNLWDG